jgi:hypothetical protein
MIPLLASFPRFPHTLSGTLYKFVTSPLELSRVDVPPVPGHVSRAFSSNAAWLSRTLHCSCAVGEEEVKVVTSRDGGFVAADGVLQQHQRQVIECAVTQQVLALGVCR